MSKNLCFKQFSAKTTWAHLLETFIHCLLALYNIDENCKVRNATK